MSQPNPLYLISEWFYLSTELCACKLKLWASELKGGCLRADLRRRRRRVAALERQLAELTRDP